MVMPSGRDYDYAELADAGKSGRIIAQTGLWPPLPLYAGFWCGGGAEGHAQQYPVCAISVRSARRLWYAARGSVAPRCPTFAEHGETRSVAALH